MNNKLVTYLCCVIILVFAMTLTVISPLLAEISDTFSLSMSQSGFIFTAYFIGFVAFILIGGILSERWDKKTVMAISLAVFTATLLLFPLSPNFFMACILMAFMGASGGIVETLSNALVADINTVNTSFYVNLVQVFFGIGALVGPVSAGYLVSSGISWKLCYYVLGILYLIITIIFISVKMPQLPSSAAITLADLKALATDKKFLLICLCMIFYTGSEVGGWGWLSTFLKESSGFSVTKSSFAVAVFWAAMTVGRLVCGQLTFRFSLRQMVIVLAFLSSAVTLLSGFISNEVLLWTVIIAMGLTYSSQWPFIATYGSNHANAPSGTVFSILIGSGGVGNMIVPYIMGVVGEYTNMRFAMVSPALLLFIVGLVFVKIERRQKLRSVQSL